MKTFVVKRSQWLRGGIGTLRDSDGKQCCLGFVGRQCGVPAKVLLTVSLPNAYDLGDEQFEKYPPDIAWNTFSSVNDNPRISDTEREKRLKKLALKNGFRFRFVP
jgi:hypothetical protein